MLESFIYSFNSVMPIVLLVIFGMFLKRIRFIKEEFCAMADKLVFNFVLPMESIRAISGTDFKVIFSKENCPSTRPAGNPSARTLPSL